MGFVPNCDFDRCTTEAHLITVEEMLGCPLQHDACSDLGSAEVGEAATSRKRLVAVPWYENEQ